LILTVGVIVFSLDSLDKKDNLCSWSKWDKYYEEEDFGFCCRLAVDENGEYGFNPDGSRILNDCQAVPK